MLKLLFLQKGLEWQLAELDMLLELFFGSDFTLFCETIVVQKKLSKNKHESYGKEATIKKGPTPLMKRGFALMDIIKDRLQRLPVLIVLLFLT